MAKRMDEEQFFDIVAANPGFSAVRASPHADGGVEFRNSPVVAWVIGETVNPVTVDSGTDWKYGGVMFPDGRVLCFIDEMIYNQLNDWQESIMRRESSEREKIGENLLRPDFTKKK